MEGGGFVLLGTPLTCNPNPPGGCSQPPIFPNVPMQAVRSGGNEASPCIKGGGGLFGLGLYSMQVDDRANTALPILPAHK